jgi:hypothetical protein
MLPQLDSPAEPDMLDGRYALTESVRQSLREGATAGKLSSSGVFADQGIGQTPASSSCDTREQKRQQSTSGLRWPEATAAHPKDPTPKRLLVVPITGFLWATGRTPFPSPFSLCPSLLPFSIPFPTYTDYRELRGEREDVEHTWR